MKKNVYLIILTLVTVICIIGGTCYHLVGWGVSFLSHLPFASFYSDSDDTESSGTTLSTGTVLLPSFNTVKIDSKVMNLSIEKGDDYSIQCDTTEKLNPKYEIKDDEHKKMSNPLFQPAMNTYFNSADEFFGRTVEEYKNWLLNNTREQLEFVLLDLIRLSENKKVLCDCHLTVAQALAFSEPARVVFLIKDPSNLVDEYGNRPDHQGFFQYLNSATDIEKAKQTVNITLYELNVNRIEEIKSSSFFWIERTVDSTVESTLTCVEKHLGLI